MNLSTKQKQTTDIEKETCGSQGGVGGRGVDWESLGLGRQLLHTEWRSNRVCCTAQELDPLSWDNHNGQEHFLKNYMCVCVCN